MQNAFFVPTFTKKGKEEAPPRISRTCGGAYRKPRTIASPPLVKRFTNIIGLLRMLSIARGYRPICFSFASDCLASSEPGASLMTVCHSLAAESLSGGFRLEYMIP